MICYHKQGWVPEKKHTAEYLKKGELVCEQLFSTKGFSGIFSTLYYKEAPACLVKSVEVKPDNQSKVFSNAPFEFYHFDTNKIKEDDAIFNRNAILMNNVCEIGVYSIAKENNFYNQNVSASEMHFVHKGEGVFLSPFGSIQFKSGDYLIIPKGIVYKIKVKSNRNRFLYVESKADFLIPKEYRSVTGQFNEMAPYSERDFRLPILSSRSKRVNRKGFEVLVKKNQQWFQCLYKNDLTQVLGWDGYLYPFAFNIVDFCPKVGKVHLPPSVHRVFENENLVICNFVPRILDFHDRAISTPYYHMNIDSEEVLYYLNSNFLSRTGVGEGSMTYHPAGLTHGPQPGKREAGLKLKETTELAVMVDTFSPLHINERVAFCRDVNYSQSWLFNKKGKS